MIFMMSSFLIHSFSLLFPFRTFFSPFEVLLKLPNVSGAYKVERVAI